MSRKTLTIAVATLMLGTAPTFAQQELKFPNWMFTEDAMGAWWDDGIAYIEEKYPDITFSKTTLSAADFEKQVTTQIAAGVSPDFMPLFTNMLAPMIDAGQLMPLDECIAQGGHGETILPSISFAQVDGVTYGVPLTMSPWSMVVNHKLLEEAGVGVPTTLDEMYAAAKAVKERTGNYGFAFGNDMAAAIHVYINAMQFVIGNGSDFSQADGTITVNDPRNVEAITWIKRYLDEGLAPIGLNIASARDLFNAGQVAIMFEGPWLMTPAIEALGAENVTYEVMPTPTHAAITGGAFLGIPTNSAHPEAACDLLNFYLTEDMQRRWLEEFQQIPGTTVQPSAEFLAQNPWVANMVDIAAKYPGGIGYAAPGYVVQSAEFRQLVVDKLSEIYSGAVSVEDGLNELQADMEAWAGSL